MLRILLCAGAGALVYRLGRAAGRLDNRLEALNAAAVAVAEQLAGHPYCAECDSHVAHRPGCLAGAGRVV